MPDVDKPTIFISHKHADSKIAEVLAAFCAKASGEKVEVFLSSKSEFKGPQIGRNLNQELMKKLWKTDVLLLVYTSSDQDWSYCMWECGVANDSQSPETNIVVFQCGLESPALFNDTSRVNARDPDNIKRFVNDLLRSKTFFPSLNGECLLPDYRDSFVADDAAKLHESFKAVLPKDPGSSQEWPTWPFLRIELPQGEVERMQQASEAERVGLSQDIVKNFGVVLDSDARAAQLFGQTTFQPRVKLGAVLKTWQDKNPNLEPTWFHSICEQMMTGAGRGFPVIRWTPLREADRDIDYTPVLSRVKSRPYASIVHFDIYFYNLSDPRAIPVSTKMMSVSELFYKQIGKIDPEKENLNKLIDELTLRERNRVPILSSEGFPLYIVHRSMIEKFLLMNYRLPGGAEKANSLTLADLLSDAEMKAIFENTFVIVSRQATLAEAHGAMVSKKDCLDVFVTAGGSSKEPVVGWLSNVDMARST